MNAIEPVSPPRLGTLVEGCRAALEHALRTDPDVFLLGEDIADAEGGGTFKVTQGLSTAHGVDRVRTTPISEQAIVGAAIGAAIAGMRPVAEIMLMNFAAVAMDQIVNHAAKLRYMSGGQTGVPLTIRTATGAGRGTGAQHSDMAEAWFAHVPGLKVVMPSTPGEAQGLLLACIYDDDPCIFIEKKEMYGIRGELLEPGTQIPLSTARTVRSGTDVTLVSYGGGVALCSAAADELVREGVNAEIIDLRTIQPWDREAVLTSAAKTRRVVIAHEAVGQFGPAAEISSVIHEAIFSSLDAPVARVASANTPVPFSSSLESAYLYQAADVIAAARGVLGVNKPTRGGV